MARDGSMAYIGRDDTTCKYVGSEGQDVAQAANGASAESPLPKKENSRSLSSLLFLELLIHPMHYAVVQKHGFCSENEKGSNEITVNYRLQTEFWANRLPHRPQFSHL